MFFFHSLLRHLVLFVKMIPSQLGTFRSVSVWTAKFRQFQPKYRPDSVTWGKNWITSVSLHLNAIFLPIFNHLCDKYFLPSVFVFLFPKFQKMKHNDFRGVGFCFSFSETLSIFTKIQKVFIIFFILGLTWSSFSWSSASSQSYFFSENNHVQSLRFSTIGWGHLHPTQECIG